MSVGDVSDTVFVYGAEPALSHKYLSPITVYNCLFAKFWRWLMDPYGLYKPFPLLDLK